MALQTEALVARKGDGSLSLETVHLAELAPDEVYVRIVSSSICRADLHSAHNEFFIKTPMVPGHEGCGIVERLGALAATRLSVGQHVILSFGFCSSCRFCVTGRPANCAHGHHHNFGGKRGDGSAPIFGANGQPIGGLFFSQSSWARIALAHMSCVVPVDLTRDELRWAGAFSCGVMTGAGSVLNICRPPAGASVAVFGAGGVGLAAVMAFALSTPRHLFVIDMQQSRLDLARSLGATHTLLASEDAVARISELTGGGMLDYAVDCVGHPSVAGIAHRCLASCGTVVLVGSATEPGATPKINMVEHLIGSKSWVGSHQGNSNPQVTIPLLISLWRAGRFPIEKLLKSCAFASLLQRAQAEAYADDWRDVATAITDMESGATVKPVLVFE